MPHVHTRSCLRVPAVAAAQVAGAPLACAHGCQAERKQEVPLGHLLLALALGSLSASKRCPFAVLLLLCSSLFARDGDGDGLE